MRWSLERALESDVGASVTALASIDNSEVANAVYLANYPDENASGVLMRRNIEHLSSVETLDARFGGADVWTLSPPCQPYTRKGKHLHGEDPRAGSFARILEALPKLREPPDRILVENVVGFELSETRRALVAALDEAGYVWREYHASPFDIGVPCTRTRYYALAKRKPLSFVDCAEDARPLRDRTFHPHRVVERVLSDRTVCPTRRDDRHDLATSSAKDRGVPRGTRRRRVPRGGGRDGGEILAVAGRGVSVVRSVLHVHLGVRQDGVRRVRARVRRVHRGTLRRGRRYRAREARRTVQGGVGGGDAVLLAARKWQTSTGWTLGGGCPRGS